MVGLTPATWEEGRNIGNNAVFHPKPHQDEGARFVKAKLMGTRTFDIDKLDIVVASHNEFTAETIRAYESLGWTFFNHGDGEHNEYGKDEDGNPREEQSSVEMPLDRMKSDSPEFRERFNIAMMAKGVQKEDLDGCFARFTDYLDYCAKRDGDAHGRMLGRDWCIKWIGKTSDRVIVRGEVLAGEYSTEQVRDLLRLMDLTMMGQTLTDMEPLPGVDSDVEDLICECIRDLKEIWWHEGWKPGITLLEIVEQLQNPPGATPDETKKSRRVNRILIEAIELLHKVIYSMNNGADYADDHAWLVTQHQVTHPNSRLPFPYEQGMRIEDVIEKLEGMTDEEASNLGSNRGNMISIMKGLLNKELPKQKNMRLSCGGERPKLNESRDERTWQSLEGLHNTLKLLIQFAKDKAMKAKFGIELTAKDWCMAVLRAFWIHRQLVDLARKELEAVKRNPDNTRAVSNNWDEEKMGRPVPMVIFLNSANPTIVSQARKQGYDMVVNVDPNGQGLYIGFDQMLNEPAWVTEALGRVAWCLRIPEFRELDLRVPEDEIELFMTTDMVDDLRWWLASKHGNAFALLNGSIHHPDVKRSALDMDLLRMIVHLVFAISWIADKEEQEKEYASLRHLLKNEDMKYVPGQCFMMTVRILGPLPEEEEVVA